VEVSDGRPILGGLQRGRKLRTARMVKADYQINDLLGSSQFDTKKHEIKLDRDGKMSVTDVVSSKSPQVNKVVYSTDP
jgi:hypothetical protein